MTKIDQFTINNEICSEQHVGENVYNEKNITGAFLPLEFQFKN